MNMAGQTNHDVHVSAIKYVVADRSAIQITSLCKAGQFDLSMNDFNSSRVSLPSSNAWVSGVTITC